MRLDAIISSYIFQAKAMTTLRTHFLKNSRIGSGTVAKEVKYDEKCQTIHLELGTQRKMPREVICLTKSDIWLFVALTQLYKNIPQCGFNNSIGNIHNMCFWNTNQCSGSKKVTQCQALTDDLEDVKIRDL